MVSTVSLFPIGILGQVWYLIVSIPDLCILTCLEPDDRFTVCFELILFNCLQIKYFSKTTAAHYDFSDKTFI